MAQTQTGGGPAERQHDRAGVGDLNSVVGVAGVVLAVVAMLIPPALPYHAGTTLDLMLILATASAATWLVLRARAWHAQRNRRGLGTAAVTTLVFLAATTYSVQPSGSGYGRAQCTFGPFGLGLGTVWIKAQRDTDAVNKVHSLRIEWGAYRAQIVVPLDEDTYFTFTKRDIRSPGVDAIITPVSVMTCGQGTPPADARQVALTRDLWQHTG